MQNQGITLNETIISLALVGYEMIIANSAPRLLLPSHTAISRKVLGKNLHATIPKGNMWYDQYKFADTIAVEPTFVDLNIRPLPLVPIFQISLKNSELKTTHNTFRDCRVHFFRQPQSSCIQRVLVE